MASLNITWSNGKVNYEDRCTLLNQKGMVVWLTGLSGSGKSTISIALEKELYNRGKLSYRIDGDNIRHGLNHDLQFSENDRTENVRRIAEVASLFADAGLITLVSCISPHIKMRNFARELLKKQFIEVYVKADLTTCLKRDPKGLYKKVINEQISNFTGMSSQYEPPVSPELVLDTDIYDVDICVHKVLTYILERFD